MPQQFDAVILGSGQAGNPLAAAFAAQRKRVAIVENHAVGGTCVNWGCTPTKAMAWSARAAYLARRAGEFGVETGPVSVDMAKVRERKRAIVDQSRGSSEKSLETNEFITLLRGEGSFASATEVLVHTHGGGTEEITAPLIFINTGLRTTVPPGFDTVPYLTNETIMELHRVPERLLILGGSYIAVEFGQMFRRYGAEVAILNHGPHLLPREDPDVSEALEQILREDGIELHLGAKAAGAEGNVTVHLEGQGSVTGSHLLLAAGRTPNTEPLNLAKAGIELGEGGFIPVNERLETRTKGIYALGDVKGGPAFTHISYDDYRIVSANLLEGGSRTTAGRPLPYSVYTDPQLGRIGMSEKQARESGRNIRVAKMNANIIARAFETGDTRGMMKVVVDRDTEQILGAAVLVAEGGEIAAMLQLAMQGNLPYTALRDGIFAHPAWAESLNKIFTKWVD